MYNMINIVQFLLIAFTVMFFPESQTFFNINAFFSGAMILNESRQVLTDGFSYFSEAFNYLDITGNVFIIISAFNLSAKPGEKFYKDTHCNRDLIIGILLVGLRAYSNLRIFENYRVQIQLFKQIFVDIFWFMSILMMLVFLMAIVFGIQFSTKDTEGNSGSPSSILTNYPANVGLFYMFMLGENAYDGLDMTPTSWLVYVVFTMLVQVIALNLLIAILSETFANVYATMGYNHCRTKVEILLEISGIKCLIDKSQDHKFLHFAIYSSEKLLERQGSELKT